MYAMAVGSRHRNNTPQQFESKLNVTKTLVHGWKLTESSLIWSNIKARLGAKKTDKYVTNAPDQNISGTGKDLDASNGRKISRQNALANGCKMEIVWNQCLLHPSSLFKQKWRASRILQNIKHCSFVMVIRDALCTYKWFGKCTWRVVCCRSRSLPQVQSSMSLFRPPRMVPTPRLCGLHPGLLRQLIAASGNVTSSHPHNNTSSQQYITTTIHHKNSDPLVAMWGTLFVRWARLYFNHLALGRSPLSALLWGDFLTDKIAKCCPGSQFALEWLLWHFVQVMLGG